VDGPQPKPGAVPRAVLFPAATKSTSLQIPSLSMMLCSNPAAWWQNGQTGATRTASTQSSRRHRAISDPDSEISFAGAIMEPVILKCRGATSPTRPLLASSRSRSNGSARFRSVFNACAIECVAALSDLQCFHRGPVRDFAEGTIVVTIGLVERRLFGQKDSYNAPPAGKSLRLRSGIAEGCRLCLRLTEPNFTRPLGDRHEHNIHNPDAAHDERHGCDHRQ
jgi:hypothetical protein